MSARFAVPTTSNERRIAVQVSELMSQELITVEPQDSVEEAVKLLRRRGVRHLLVIK